MPKVLEYITRGICWIFLFWDTDKNENRAHVHVGKKASERLCKIWLEPEIEVADSGDMSDNQIKQIIGIVQTYREQLMCQWDAFKKGARIKIIKIRK